MANRWGATLVLVGLGFGLGTAWDALGQPGLSAFHHPGRVTDQRTGRPLGAAVKAWPESARSGIPGPCPQYGKEPLDATTSDGDGRFSLAIDRAKKTYTVVYCESGYHPRADTDLPNRQENPVIPVPAQLWPVNAGPDAAFYDAIERRALGSMNDLSYLRSVNSEVFDKIMLDVAFAIAPGSENHATVVRNLSALVQQWDRPAQ
jgi:hypothetical protein